MNMCSLYERKKGLVDKVSGLIVKQSDLPLVVSIRTGLAGRDDAIERKVPMEYADRDFKSLVSYMITDVSEDRSSLAESVKREISQRGSVLVANGKTVDLSDKVGPYLAQKEHILANGKSALYRELEMEVSAVQQGGYQRLC